MMRWTVLLPLAAWTVAAQDAQTEYKEKLAQLRRNVAAGHANIGEFLAGKKMHRWAREEFNRAIALDPDCEKARLKLGFQKVDGKWEFDGGKTVPTTNQLTGKDADRVRKEYDSKLLDHGKRYAKEYVTLAAWCDKGGLKDEAKALYKSAVEYDPSNATARKALGYEKEKDGPWLSPFERQFRKESKEGIAKAPKGKPSTTQLQVESGLGYALTKQEHDNFVVASPHLNKANLEDLIQHAEHAYAMWHKLFNQKDLFGEQKMQFLILKDKSQHEAYVDKFYQGDGANKELARKSEGVGGFPLSECYQGEREQNSLQDNVIHYAIQRLQEGFAEGKETAEHHPVWLTEGTALYFTRLMKNTAHWSCVALAGTGTGRQPAKKEPENWPIFILAKSREGEDPDIAAVVKCTTMAELDGAETVKAWSLVDFLIAEHREKFIEFCQDLRGAGDNGEESFKKVFGWSLEDLDSRWRAFVKVAYAGQ